jgi:hypothetical protein
MKMKKETTERESKQFYAVDNGSVTIETSYKCVDALGEYQGYWWVPSLGYSMKVGHSLFGTRKEAVIKANEFLERVIKNAEQKIKELNEL